MNRQYTAIELDRYNIRDLMTIAGELGIDHRHRLTKKDDFINAILHKQQHNGNDTTTGCGCKRNMNNAQTYNSHRRSGDYTNAVMNGSPIKYNESPLRQTVGTMRGSTTQNGHRRSGDYANVVSSLGLNGNIPLRNARRSSRDFGNQSPLNGRRYQ